jgi:hypothetical protein
LSDLGLDLVGDLSAGDGTDLMATLGGHDLSSWLLAAAVLLLMLELGLGRGART